MKLQDASRRICAVLILIMLACLPGPTESKPGEMVAGIPKLSTKVLGTTVQAPGVFSVYLQFTNTGDGDAQNLLVNQVVLRTLSGSGTITLASPTMPVSLGTLNIGGSTNVLLTMNIPATVTRFSLTENGTLQDVAGTTLSFSLAQSFLPGSPTNRPPVAGNDSANTTPDIPVDIAVMANDSDPNGQPLSVSTFTQPANGIVSFSGGTARYTPNTGFSGRNQFSYTITDGIGGTATAIVSVRVNRPPTVTLLAEPSNGTAPLSVTLTATASDPEGDALVYTWEFGDGATTTGAASIVHAYQAGNYTAKVTSSDGLASAEASAIVAANASVPVPPDPTTVAPALDPTVSTSMADATAFLYSGSSPIQTGLAPATIAPQRAAVVRGKVITRDGPALPGVRISILNHPEFGQTMSRADGMFDMAVNGGGLLIVSYEKDGFLPAQRPVQAPWQDFVLAPDVVLVPYDTQATLIDLASVPGGPLAPMQVARGSVVMDLDGRRQATLLFPQGATATMVKPDGITAPLPRLTVRATEYTVGPNGPQAMPGELPPTSGYTYAVELSADEAVAAGAKSVTFSQPVIQYVENFLSFPVGLIVPAGFYDRDRAAWVPSENGRVIKIIGIVGGVADVDTVGTGALPALTLGTIERERLAALYPVGQELWRVPITHFTPWDYNWPFGLPDDARDPRMPRGGPGNPDDDCDEEGSIIECLSQTLAETVPITGTPFHLRYGSDRTPGRKITLDIPLSDAQIPASLRRIELQISIAGRNSAQSFPPTPNQSHRFAWDRKDAFERQVQGGTVATVRIGYVYGAVYQTPAEFQKSFAAFSGAVSAIPISDRTRQEITIWQVSQYLLGTLPADGWSLSPHHAYDPNAEILFLGHGARRSFRGINAVITTVAGAGSANLIGSTGDGGPATQALMSFPGAVAVAPDGSLYIADTSNHRIRRVAPDGIITTVVGTNVPGFSGDGGTATQARLNNPFGVAVAPDGSLFIADRSNHRIRRVGPDGIITTVAGTGVQGFSGDGGTATQAQLIFPSGVTVAPDGSFYIADSSNHRIRRVGPDGIITTAAGIGTPGFSGDGGTAAQARLNNPFGVTVAPDGSFYIADSSNHRIRRVGPDGAITTVAGTGVPVFGGDGGLATQARLNNPFGVGVAPDGSFYIADTNNQRIRRVGADGIITTVAGSGAAQPTIGDGGPAAQAQLNAPRGVAVAPDGSVYIADRGNQRIRRVDAPEPGFSGAGFEIPSADDSELYRFNPSGRHLQTLNALTGAVRYAFTYDSGGRLIGITDGDGNVTTIEREANGNPTAIVAPGGQRTTLAVGANGFFTAITNPAGEAVRFSYTSDGLLTTGTDAKGNVHRFAYDTLGRLIRDEDPAGGVMTLSRVDTDNGHEVTLTTSLGRVSTYTFESLPTGEVRRVNSNRAGARTTVLTAPNGSVTVTSPDGTRTTVQRGPDPRFGMLAPVATSVTHTAPGGRTLTQTSQRTVTLADPNNPLSLQTLTDTITINGRTFTVRYDAAARTMTTTSPEGRQSVAILDTLGRVTTKQLDPNLAPMTVSRDALGRVTGMSQGEQGLIYSYDAANRVVSRLDAAGNRTTYAYDTADRPTQVTLPSSRTLRFANDANGNRTQVVMPSGAVHTLDYTSLDREASYTPPGNASYLRSYNADRALARSTLPGNRIVEASYDSAGRGTGFNYAEAAIVFGYGTGDATDRVRRIARTPVATGSSQELTFSYDGAQVTGTTWTGAAQAQISHTYDNNFFLTATQLVSNADTVQTTFVRDREGLITGYGPFTFTRGGPAGAVSQISDGSLSSTFTYDTMGRITNRLQNVGSQQRFQAQFTYDATGRIVRKVETVAGIVHTYNYNYDLDGQLIEVLRDGALAERYSYDANGNRLSRQLGGSPLEAATYDDQDRLIRQGSTTYQFDSDGFLAQRGPDTFLYSARGELLRATAGGQTVTYSYDGLGRRVGQTTTAGATQYLYGNPGNAFSLTAVRDPSGVLTTLFYDEEGLLVALERGGSRFYVATDQVGTPRLVTDSTGQAVRMLEFDSFGNLISDSNPGFFLPIGFAGGLADPMTGFVRFGFRDYDPVAGRWTARDPIRFAGGQGNLFAYVSNNPINLRDPLGLFCIGASAYFLIGGGAEICYEDGDFSICGELGFGFGGSVDANGDEAQENGAKLLLEAEAKCGPVGGEIGASLSDTGCLQTKLKAELGFVTIEKDEEGHKLGVTKGIEVSKGGRCGIEAKLALKVCGGTK